jgi:hypothetical protein
MGERQGQRGVIGQAGIARAVVGDGAVDAPEIACGDAPAHRDRDAERCPFPREADGARAGIRVPEALIGLATWLTIRRAAHDRSRKDVYLAKGRWSWLFVAGAITLTNLSTDQLAGMNGKQMLLLAWWAIAGFAGFVILALCSCRSAIAGAASAH